MEDSDVHGRETRKSDHWMSVHRLVAFMETVSHISRVGRRSHVIRPRANACETLSRVEVLRADVHGALLWRHRARVGRAYSSRIESGCG